MANTLGTMLKVVGALEQILQAAGPAAAELKEAFAKKGVTAADWKALAKEWGDIAALAQAEIETKR